jgi:NADP-dependent 3-hydroxy acid dehydrogenase YdfG
MQALSLSHKKKVCILTGCTSGLGLNILYRLLSIDLFIYGISNNKQKIKALKNK